MVQKKPDMRVSVTDAKAQLTELVRRAEAGEEIVLTRHGHEAVRLTPMRVASDHPRRRFGLERFIGVLPKVAGEPSAARSQDFLYDEDGLPK